MQSLRASGQKRSKFGMTAAPGLRGRISSTCDVIIARSSHEWPSRRQSQYDSFRTLASALGVLSESSRLCAHTLLAGSPALDDGVHCRGVTPRARPRHLLHRRSRQTRRVRVDGSAARQMICLEHAAEHTSLLRYYRVLVSARLPRLELLSKGRWRHS